MQQRVAHMVAQRVVDVLEAVQVDEQHAHLFAAAARLRDGGRQAQFRHVAVRQARERVVVGHVLDLPLAGLAFADVERTGDEMRGDAIEVAHGVHHQPGGIAFHRLALHRDFSLPVAAPRQGLAQAVELLGTVVRREQEGRSLADQLHHVVQRMAAEGLVDGDDAHVGIHHDQAFSRCLEDLGPQFQARLHQLHLVDRREGRQHRALALVVDQARGNQGPGGRAAAAPAHLEFIDGAQVAQALEEARTGLRMHAAHPRVPFQAALPRVRGLVRVQHLVMRDRGDHQRDGNGVDQLALRIGRAGARHQVLLRHALEVELLQHGIEGADQAPRFILAVPDGAQAMVARFAHFLRHARQAADGQGDLPRDEKHQAQYHHQQQHGGAQVQPHAREKAVHAQLDQAV